MLKLNLAGSLGKFGWSDIPGDIADKILEVATMQAYKTAVQKAPVDPADPPVHIKDELKWHFLKDKKLGEVWVRLPYANIAEYGSKHRLPHPFMRPASAAARNKMRAVVKMAAKQAIAEEKAKHGNS